MAVMTRKRGGDQLALSIATCTVAKCFVFVTAGTHDIENITASVTRNNTVRISVYYFSGSVAKGTLLNFVYKNNTDGQYYSYFQPVERNASSNYILPFDLPDREFEIFAYDIKRNGTLYSGVGYPAILPAPKIRVENTSRHGKAQTLVAMCTVIFNQTPILTIILL